MATNDALRYSAHSTIQLRKCSPFPNLPNVCLHLAKELNCGTGLPSLPATTCRTPLDSCFTLPLPYSKCRELKLRTKNMWKVKQKKCRLWIDQVGWSSCSIGVFDRITNIILGAFRMHELVQTKGTLQLQFHRRDLVAAGQTHFMEGLSDLCHLYSSKHQTSKVAAEMVRTTRTSAGYSST